MSISLKYSCGEFTGGLFKLSEARQRYEAARSVLAKSKTAQEILAYVDNHDTEITLVCIPGGEGEMLFPGEIEGHDDPTVIWDPNKHFQFYCNVAKIGNQVYADLKSYQPAIVLIHELGHAKQWLSNPNLHESRFHRGAEGIAEIEAENLKMHEAPVAKELGLPVRVHYKHFPNSSEALAPKNVKLLHAAEEGKSGAITTGKRNRLTQ